jgi:IS5 family transposase
MGMAGAQGLLEPGIIRKRPCRSTKDKEHVGGIHPLVCVTSGSRAKFYRQLFGVAKAAEHGCSRIAKTQIAAYLSAAAYNLLRIAKLQTAGSTA